jgi:hypothetical protein
MTVKITWLIADDEQVLVPPDCKALLGPYPPEYTPQQGDTLLLSPRSAWLVGPRVLSWESDGYLHVRQWLLHAPERLSLTKPPPLRPAQPPLQPG